MPILKKTGANLDQADVDELAAWLHRAMRGVNFRPWSSLKAESKAMTRGLARKLLAAPPEILRRYVGQMEARP